MYLVWKDLIKERDEWIAHNFPNPTQPNPGDSIDGCIEELGELAHALLKMGQNIRGTADEHTESARDAVGDLSIYLLGVMSMTQYSPNHLLAVHVNGSVKRIAYWVGNLCHLYESSDHRTVSYANCIDNIVANLYALCEGRGWSYEDIVQETWDQVAQRDWIQFPNDGVTS
jgi:hypothetical protein